DLGDDRLSGRHPDPGDLVQAADRVERGRVVASGSWAGRRRRRGRDVAEELLDPQRQAVDLGAEGVDLVEEQGDELAMVLVEAPVERLFEGGPLGAHLSEGELSQDPGITLPGDQGVE